MSTDGLDTRDLKRRLESKLFGDSALAVPTLGRFTIIGRLGQGGMGTVFAAYDPHLDRKVALKVLRGGGEANPDRQARMLREAQALAKLSHPNVVSIHEVGTVDGEIFMALEYVSGGSLADVETTDFGTLLEWLVQAGEGLEAAHQQGLVHRDVKPANILITGDGRAKVSDFGLATDPRQGQLEVTFDGSSASSSGLSTQLEQAGVLKTETGALVGTPAFMAPEQLDGATVDARTDQFAFCVTAYRVLEGRPPFPGPTVAALRESITHGPQPVKHMPGWLERIVARGLSEDPALRHASMRELVDAIERGRRPRDWKRSAFALGIVGTLGVAWALSSEDEATDPCDAFDDALADVWNDGARAKGREAFEATSQPYAAAAWVRTADSVEGYVAAWTDGARSSCEQTFRKGVQSDEAHDLRMGCLQRARVDLEALVAILDDADAGVVSHAESLVLGLPDLRACERVEELRAEGLPPDDPNATVAQEHIAHARSAIAAGRMDEAHEAATKALEAAEAAQWPAARAEALLALGKSGQELGKLEEAEAQLRLALDVAESNRVDRIAAEAWIELLSNVVDFQTRPEPLDALSRRAEAAVHRIGDPPKLEVRRLTTLGRAKEVAGDYPGALQALRSAMALVDANDELPTVTRILAMHQLASTLSVMGDPDEAVVLRTQALTLAKAELGDRHPTVAKLLSSLAVDYMDVPDDERALELFNESIALRDSLGIPAAAPYGNRGQLLVNMGRPREALPDFERAIALFSGTVGPDHPTIGAFKLQQATAYLTLRENDVGVKLLEEADALLAKQLPPEHPHRLAATINLATVLIEQGKSAEALAKAEGARKAMLEQSQPCSQPVMSTSTVIAGALLEVGRPADALAELDAIEACWETRPPDAVTSQADLTFNQARALKALGRIEEARAHALESRKLHEELGPNYAEQVVQIDAWLETL